MAVDSASDEGFLGPGRPGPRPAPGTHGALGWGADGVRYLAREEHRPSCALLLPCCLGLIMPDGGRNLQS